MYTVYSMNQNSNNDITMFHEKMRTYISNIPNSSYIIEVTKLCGYSEFIIIRKDSTLLDLYKHVSFSFGEIKRLFVQNLETNEGMLIPLTLHKTLREFIVQHTFIRPKYDNMLCPVVYVVYVDDFHCEHNCNSKR